MEKFIEPEIEILTIEVVDVITTSDTLVDVEDGMGWG